MLQSSPRTSVLGFIIASLAGLGRILELPVSGTFQAIWVGTSTSLAICSGLASEASIIASCGTAAILDGMSVSIDIPAGSAQTFDLHGLVGSCPKKCEDKHWGLI